MDMVALLKYAEIKSSGHFATAAARAYIAKIKKGYLKIQINRTHFSGSLYCLKLPDNHISASFLSQLLS
ncbi:hypothetical protein HMPREF3043_06285 [Eikenella sp. HMSC073A11]|nr:hypothetical protein HMPREF3043_06285 [Eikenella sp. HMSC073A11]